MQIFRVLDGRAVVVVLVLEGGVHWNISIEISSLSVLRGLHLFLDNVLTFGIMFLHQPCMRNVAAHHLLRWLKYCAHAVWTDNKSEAAN